MQRVRIWVSNVRLSKVASILDYSECTHEPTVRIHERVELEVFPSALDGTKPSYKSRIHQPLGRIDIEFQAACDFSHWIETNLLDSKYTRRLGLVAWCCKGYTGTLSRRAHKRCCCHMHHESTLCDVCDATRAALAEHRIKLRMIKKQQQKQRKSALSNVSYHLTFNAFAFTVAVCAVYVAYGAFLSCMPFDIDMS
jgi:hypothetical protein